MSSLSLSRAVRSFLREAPEDPSALALERIAWRGWTVLDATGFAGDSALKVFKLGGPAACVHAFGSDPIEADLLAERIEHEGAEDGVTVVSAAAGARSGTRRTAGPLGETLTVSLDEHCAVHGLRPGLVMLRDDGYATDAVAGMQHLLSARVPRFVIAPDSPAIRAAFAAHEYRALRITPDGGLVQAGAAHAPALCFARD